MKDGDITQCWVYFHYEILPEFYYWCSYTGHSEKDCDRRDGVAEVVQWPYDPLLRASSEKPCKPPHLLPSNSLPSLTKVFSIKTTYLTKVFVNHKMPRNTESTLAISTRSVMKASTRSATLPRCPRAASTSAAFAHTQPKKKKKKDFRG